MRACARRATIGEAAARPVVADRPMIDVVLTLIGTDRPGLVESVAAIIAAHQGNWVESRMTQLAGKFAGILRAELPPQKVDDAVRALRGLESRGIRVVVETAPRQASVAQDSSRKMVLDLMGLDRPGIVHEISQLLSSCGVNVEELTTNRSSAPMSGDMLFQARAHVALPASTNLAHLRAALERVGNDLMVDVKLESPVEAQASKTAAT
jgi:glycine cleavage system regulatory protein